MTAAAALVLAGCTTANTTSNTSTSSTTPNVSPTTSTLSASPSPTQSPTTAAPSRLYQSAGALYSIVDDHTISVIPLGSTKAQASITVGSGASYLAIAPAGTPNAGTVYVPGDGSVSVIPPGADTVSATIAVDNSDMRLTFAPAGTPNAGTLFVSFGSRTVSVIAPGATTAATVSLPRKVRGYGWAVVAPAGVPNAGTLYVADGRGVSVIAPGATTATDISLPSAAQFIRVAPAGTPNAGTVYVTNGNGISVIPPGASSVQARIRIGPQPDLPVMAPPGTPNAGTIYIGEYRAGTVSVIRPGATAVEAKFKIGDGAITIAPAGTPNAGTVYVASGPKSGDISVIAPHARTAQSVRVGGNAYQSDLLMVPAGSPHAGTVYVASSGRSGSLRGTLSVIRPGAAAVAARISLGIEPNGPVMAPAGAPNAGSLFFGDAGGSTISVIPPGATKVGTRITLPNFGNWPVVAPAGTPNAGTLYFPIAKKVWVIPPGATAACALSVYTDSNSLAFGTSPSSVAQSPTSASSAPAESVCPPSAPTWTPPPLPPNTSVSHVLVLGTDGVIRDGDGKVMPTRSKKASDKWLAARVGTMTGDYSGSFGRLNVNYYNGKYQGWDYGDSWQNYTGARLSTTDHLKTPAGVGIGTTYAQALAAYPSLAHATWTTDGPRIGAVIPGTRFRLDFSSSNIGSDMPSASPPPALTAKLLNIFWTPR